MASTNEKEDVGPNHRGQITGNRGTLEGRVCRRGTMLHEETILAGTAAKGTAGHPLHTRHLALQPRLLHHITVKSTDCQHPDPQRPTSARPGETMALIGFVTVIGTATVLGIEETEMQGGIEMTKTTDIHWTDPFRIARIVTIALSVRHIHPTVIAEAETIGNGLVGMREIGGVGDETTERRIMTEITTVIVDWTATGRYPLAHQDAPALLLLLCLHLPCLLRLEKARHVLSPTNPTERHLLPPPAHLPHHHLIVVC